MTPDAATIASKLTKPSRTGSGWKACCPAHDDSDPSLSINDGDKGPVFKCHAGCSQEAVLNAIEALGITIRKPKNGHSHDMQEPQEVLSVETLAAAKGFTLDTLTTNLVTEDANGVGFRYADAAGEVLGTKWRKHLGGGSSRGFRWQKGARGVTSSLYGLWRLERDYANDNRVILVEGETDALTLWQHGFTALGVPGADNWNEEWADLIPEGARIYVVLEPDQGGQAMQKHFTASKLKKRTKFIRMPMSVKDANGLHMASDAGFVDDFERFITAAVPAYQRKNVAIDWQALAHTEPREREWAIDHWFGMGHVTLLAGAGGTGKTSVAQAMASCLALRREYLDYIPKTRRVLMWACEDDANELHQRQVNICKGLGAGLQEFHDSFFLHSFDGEQVEIAGLADGKLVAGPMLTELHEQIADYRADVVILDNIARLYGGNENDRHQVTNFMAMLTGAARVTNAAVMLLGHPGKALGSEYSGSTAWEGAARARLYLGRSLPDREPEKDQEDDEGVRYLSRRKANYSTRDWRKIVYRDGVMVPEEAPQVSQASKPSGAFAQDVVLRAIRQLANMGKYGNASTASPEYLPKLADQYKLLDNVSRSAFAATVRQMELDGKIKTQTVGKYQNRTPKQGYVVVDSDRTNGAHK